MDTIRKRRPTNHFRIFLRVYCTRVLSKVSHVPLVQNNINSWHRHRDALFTWKLTCINFKWLDCSPYPILKFLSPGLIHIETLHCCFDKDNSQTVRNRGGDGTWNLDHRFNVDVRVLYGINPLFVVSRMPLDCSTTF